MRQGTGVITEDSRRSLEIVTIKEEFEKGGRRIMIEPYFRISST